MKTKLMAFVLAAGLGMTGITATAHAAEAAAVAENGCAHANCQEIRVTNPREIRYDNPTYHMIIRTVQYVCLDCKDTFEVDEIEGYETHDYEQVYFDDGKVMSYCTGCGDSFIW